MSQTPQDPQASRVFPEFDPEIVSEDFVAPILELFYGKNLSLPVIPQSVSSLLGACAREDPDMEEICRLTSLDQSLAAHVLRLAGSASLAPVVEIRSVDEAVRRVGIRAIADMAISHLVHVSLSKHDHPRIRELLRYSAVAGVYSYRIGKLMDSSVAPSMLPGLMHDVGRAMAVSFLLDMREWTGDNLPSHAIDYLAEELHVDLGARLAEAWNLPLTVEVAIRYHANYFEAPTHKTEAMIANLADVLARWTLDPESTQDVILPELDVVQQLGLSPNDLTRLISNLGEVLDAAAAFA